MLTIYPFVPNGNISFLFMAKWCSFIHIQHIFLIHSPNYGHFSGFCVSALVSKAAMNMGEQVSLQNSDSISFSYIHSVEWLDRGVAPFLIF